MKYTYVEFGDGTIVTFSDIKKDAAGEHIRMYFEKPVPSGFHFLETRLPDLNVVNEDGYSSIELKKLLSFAKNNSPLIWELAREALTPPSAHVAAASSR